MTDIRDNETIQDPENAECFCELPIHLTPEGWRHIDTGEFLCEPEDPTLTAIPNDVGIVQDENGVWVPGLLG